MQIRQAHAKPLADDLESWFSTERKRLSSKNRLAKAIDYHLKRWPEFTRYLDDGRRNRLNRPSDIDT